jgi:hypothetical protein
MKGADARTLTLALRAWFDEEELNAELIYEKGLAGHFAYFWLLLDLVDGKNQLHAEEEWTFEPGCVLVIAEDGLEAEPAIAA